MPKVATSASTDRFSRRRTRLSSVSKQAGRFGRGVQAGLAIAPRRPETESARQELAAQKRQVANEVASELSQSAAARSAVRVAEQSITSAQEAYRVTDALVKAGSATTTDLLEAQSALAQARLNLVRAQYQLASAYVSIQHAIGDEK